MPYRQCHHGERFRPLRPPRRALAAPRVPMWPDPPTACRIQVSGPPHDLPPSLAGGKSAAAGCYEQMKAADPLTGSAHPRSPLPVTRAPLPVPIHAPRATSGVVTLPGSCVEPPTHRLNRGGLEHSMHAPAVWPMTACSAANDGVQFGNPPMGHRTSSASSTTFNHEHLTTGSNSCSARVNCTSAACRQNCMLAACSSQVMSVRFEFFLPAKDVLWCSSLLMYLQCSF